MALILDVFLFSVYLLDRLYSSVLYFIPLLIQTH